MESEEQSYQPQRSNSQPTVSFKLSSQEEKAEIESMAQDVGMNVSEFIRDRIKNPISMQSQEEKVIVCYHPKALRTRRDFNLLYNKLREFSSLKDELQKEVDVHLLSKITVGMTYEAEPLIHNLEYFREKLTGVERKAEAVCALFLNEISDERSEAWYLNLLADESELEHEEDRWFD